MSVKDVIKSSVYESFGSGSSVPLYTILIILAVACVIGVYIYFVYKAFSRSEFYSKDLNLTIALMTLVVAAIMIAMQSNLLVSLGMVGALSIVRFRTAVKNPMDLLYLFWSISAGIIVGVHLYGLAIVLCAILTLAIWLLGKVPAAKAPALMIIRCQDDTDLDKVEATMKKNSKYVKAKSTQVQGSDQEAIYEVLATDRNVMISEVKKIAGVSAVNWVEHDGEMRN